MKILHTSDWHLGRLLYNQKRYDEFEKFLNWLLQTINKEQIELLLVAGDIFDTTVPSNRALDLYYDFLYKVSLTTCENVVIIAGNHDSPSLLNAPARILKVLNVHVVAEKTQSIEDEIISIKDANGKVQALVCAVPFLRDRDVRNPLENEGLSREEQLNKGIVAHYNEVASKANEIRGNLNIPIIAMGHLFTTSERNIDLDGEGVRDLYVGSLAYLDASLFPKTFDYVALGHIHISQQIGKKNHIRYSGSPIPMGFREARHSKYVLKVEIAEKIVEVMEIEVPRFRKLYQISGDLQEIINRIDTLKAEMQVAWLEIEHTSKELIPDFVEKIRFQLENSNLSALKISNRNLSFAQLQRSENAESLDDLSELEVFIKCLDAKNVSEQNRQELIECFNEIIYGIQNPENNLN